MVHEVSFNVRCAHSVADALSRQQKQQLLSNFSSLSPEHRNYKFEGTLEEINSLYNAVQMTILEINSYKELDNESSSETEDEIEYLRAARNQILAQTSISEPSSGQKGNNTSVSLTEEQKQQVENELEELKEELQ